MSLPGPSAWYRSCTNGLSFVFPTLCLSRDVHRPLVKIRWRMTVNVVVILLCVVTAVVAESDPCRLKPCLHNGTCINTGNGHFLCNCTKGFQGELCEEPACVDLNATCEKQAMEGECDHYPESMQRDCRKSCHLCGACVAVQCSVNRVCNTEDPPSEKGFSCDCPEGTTGEHCDKSLCNPPCQNGGVCKEVNLTCSCRPGFGGSICEKCVDEDSLCKVRAKAGQCESNARYMMAFCRRSCNNCPGKPCTRKGEFCVEGAVCNPKKTCQCGPGLKGDGRIDCSNEDDNVCVLRNDLKSYGDARANLNFPCRSRLSRLTTPLEGGGGVCSFEVFGYSMVSEVGNYYPAAAEVSLAIVDVANQVFEQQDFIKFDIDLGGIVSSEGHAVRWGSDASDSYKNVTFDCVFNNDQFAVLHIPQCQFRLKFRSYDQDAEDEKHPRPQSRPPAIVITAGQDAMFDQTELHRFPDSLCGEGGDNGDGEALYSDTATQLELDNAEEALLYSALDQNLTQQSIIEGFSEVVLQDADNCQEAVDLFDTCGNQTKRAQAIKACHVLLSKKSLLRCLGSLAQEAFNSCLDVFCNSHMTSCKIIRDDFKNARPLSRKRCPFPPSLRKLCKNLLD